MTLSLSRHTMIVGVRDTDARLIINLLSGQADLLTADEARQIESGAFPEPSELVAKGYLTDPENEQRQYRAAYLEALDRREREEIQILFAPTYACNFGCAYCYQAEYGHAAQVAGPEVLDAFFAYVDTTFTGRAKYLTLFGGEPLLPSPRHREAVTGFIERAARRGLSVAVVTNGYHLGDYLDVLSRAEIREIQVTLDGPAALHDRRRPLKGGGPTFERVVAGVDAALARGFSVNLRVVLDRDNLPALPEVAALARERGWTGNPRFKTQLGRSYELHGPQAGGSRALCSRLELHEELYRLYARDAALFDFHRPAYSVTRHLVDNGKLPEPLFDACPGTKTEWAFDYTGKIYACTATVGLDGEEVGTFYPRVHLDEERVAQWQDRDVLSIPECRDCAAQLACGGGCAVVARGHKGTLAAPDCRPIADLLSMGVGLYFELSRSGDTSQDVAAPGGAVERVRGAEV